ncbi:hypothetical protein DFH11DRAFT_1730239 [Phellopilus nigrolimitatus]|nr:hypothetical protein DFH11DRAFT_1730239 [Phellopilus nigrolimitatus]
MLVSSTLNSSARSTVHFVVVHHNDERVLLPVDMHAKYSDLQEFVAKEWEMTLRSFVFETDELDVCAGRRVRIHEEAWAGIRDIVGNVYVRTRDKGNFGLLANSMQAYSKKEQKSGFNYTVKSEMKREDNAGARQHTESADEDEVERQTRKDCQKSDDGAVKPTERGQARNHTLTPSNFKSMPGPSSSLRNGAHANEDTLNLFSDELIEKADASDGPDRTDEEEDDGNEGGAEEEEEEQVEKSISKRVERTPSATQVARILQEERSEDHQAPKNVSSTTAVPTMSETPRFVKNKNTDVKSEENGARSASSASTDRNNSDTKRVLIVVEVPDKEIEPRGFRIKREHTVQTVLKGAAKIFKVDYARSSLRMVIDDGDGEPRTVKCDNGDSMNQLNIADGQRFIIELREEEEEEEEEDEESDQYVDQ